MGRLVSVGIKSVLLSHLSISGCCGLFVADRAEGNGGGGIARQGDEEWPGGEIAVAVRGFKRAGVEDVSCRGSEVAMAGGGGITEMGATSTSGDGLDKCCCCCCCCCCCSDEVDNGKVAAASLLRKSFAGLNHAWLPITERLGRENGVAAKMAAMRERNSSLALCGTG